MLNSVFDQPSRWLVGGVLATLVLASGVLRLDVRTDGAAIHPTDNAVVLDTRADQREFRESDQVIVLIGTRPGGPLVASRDGLRFLARLHQQLEAVPGAYAQRIRSLATLVDPRPDLDVIASPDFLDEIPDDDAALQALLKRIWAAPLAPGLFLSPDGRAAALYVPTLRDASRTRLVADVQQVLSAQPGAFELRLTGPVAAEVLLGEAVLRDLARLVPLMVAVVALLLFACLRSVGGVLVPMAEVLMVLVCVLGAMGLLGVPITLVTTILPVLLMTVTVADEIHLLERYGAYLRTPDRDTEPGRSQRAAALRRALHDVGRPIVLTSLTTSAGFLSFLATSIEPVRHFGLFTAFGVLLAMAASFTFVPALVLVLPARWFLPWMSGALGERPLPAQERWLVRRGGLAAAGCLLTLALLLPGLGLLSVEDSWVDNFDPDAELVSAERAFNREFWGSYRFDIVLEAADPLFFMQAAGLRLVGEVAEMAGSAPHVGGVASHLLGYQLVADVWREPARVQDLPAARIAKIARLLSYASERTDLDQVLNPNGSKARVRLFVKSASYERADELEAFVAPRLLPLLAERRVRAHFSGDLPLARAVVGDVVSNMLRSIGWTALGVAAMLWLFFRSLRLAVITLAPLALSVPVLLALMGHVGMPIGIATSMFAAVTIGTAVDFAIHFVHRYRALRTGLPDHEQALVATLHSAGRAIRWNAVVFSLGLLVLAFSALKPDRSLGLLLAASMLTCYAATLLLLPPLLARSHRESHPNPSAARRG